MGQILKEILDDWGQGVVTSMEGDAMPQNAFLRGRNTALVSIGGGKSAIMKRKGWSTINATQITGASAVIGQYTYNRLASGAFTTFNLLVSDNGRLDTVTAAGTLTTISATAFTSSSSQEYLPSFATANNLCFIVNGTDAKKYNGTALQNFGITAPASAPTLTDSGVAGNHSGTYEGYVTFYNSATGQESSRGTVSSTVTVTNRQINWTSIPVSADSQVNARRLYLRNTSTQSNYYLVTTINDNSTTTYTSNLLDSSLTTVGPDADENDPPPSGVKYLASHRGRLYAATDTNIYYSKLTPLVESFDPENYEVANSDDGQKITGLVSAFDILIVFKTNSMYAIVGDDPDSWVVRQIDGSLGCVAHRSIVLSGSRLYWWSEQGPVMWNGSSAPQLIGDPFISTTLSPDNLSYADSALSKICAIDDITDQRILFAVPQLSQSRNTIIFPFSERLDRWESDGWDPFDVASFGSINDSTGKPFVVLGGYAGQVFRYGDTSYDGMDATKTHTGTFTATATSQSTITDSGATFLTTGGAMTERKVTVVDSDGVIVNENAVRPRITSNTATAFTLNTAITSLVVGETYTYYIGGPAFDVETSWRTGGDAFLKKRYLFVYLQLRPTNTITGLRIDFHRNFSTAPGDGRTASVAVDINAGLWDSALWDDAIWDAANNITTRYRVGKTGTALLVRLRHYSANADLVLVKVGIVAETLSERLG